MRRFLRGSVVAVLAVSALGAGMVPFRGHLSEASTALVLVVPVVAAVAVGGFPAGVVGVVAGFLVYDLVFIRPYYTLSAAGAQSWVALAVYVIVMLLVARLVGRLDDARERAMRADLLEQVDRLRRSLVGAVSHDLRTPLATIKVSTTTLLDPALRLSAADSAELIGLIDAQADRLTRLVTNLLDMTRIQAGVLEVRPQPWAVADLVEEALDSLSPAVDRSRVQLVAPPGIPALEVDHVLIGQVLANLLDNAFRHAPDGSAVVVDARDRADGTVEVGVADRGPGLTAEERHSVFDSFARFDTGGRAGLGLAIAKAFVEAHGHRIWAEEAPGGGARFAFELPAADRRHRAA